LTDVLKFGGTSVGTAGRIRDVARLVAARGGGPCVVVVSAMGGITDLLVSLKISSSERDRAAAGRAREDLAQRHVAALAGLAELRDERGLDEAITRSRYGAAAGARAAAIQAVGKLGAEHGPRRRSAREVLSDLATDDRDFRARSAAVDALASLGDADATGTLERVARADLDGRVRRRAREVARDLTAGRPQADQLQTLRDRADALEKARDELRDRLAAVEARLAPKATS